MKATKYQTKRQCKSYDCDDFLFCFPCRNLQKDLVRVCGAPELMSTPVEVYHRKAKILLQEVLANLQSFPELPQTSRDGFYPLEIFFHSEVGLLHELVEKVKRDVTFLLKVVQGEVESSALCQELLVTVSKQQIPTSWLAQAFPTSTPLLQWSRELKRKAELLKDYIKKDMGKAEGPAAYNLAAFQRPDRFIQTVLQTFVRKEFKDLHRCSLDVQVRWLINFTLLRRSDLGPVSRSLGMEVCSRSLQTCCCPGQKCGSHHLDSFSRLPRERIVLGPYF